ncbi:MAG: TRAP transporter small permease [Thiohalophilus sp.]|jgi:TRAP-type C4-dicarboxylate transport system permease small subunit
MIDAFIRLVCLLSRLCGITAAIMVLISTLVVCQMVFLRYVLEASVIWQTEFVTYLLIAATLIGSPYVLLKRGHVNVDLLPMYLGQRARFILALVASSLSLVFCIVVTWAGYKFWHEAWEYGWLSDTMWSPRLWIPYLTIPVGFGILALQYVADILSLLTGRDMPFGIAPERVQ